MRINYANRKNDKNLIEYDYLIKDSQNEAFKGKITLIKIDKVKSVASVKRPNGNIDNLEDNNYKIMTFFPEKENYSMTVFYDNNDNLLQWYFDIAENNGDFENDIPYNKDMYLDIVVLPDGTNYVLDEDEIKQSLENKKINQDQYDDAYRTLHKLQKMIDVNFELIKSFTTEAFNLLK